MRWLAPLSLTALAACATGVSAELREHTYPRELRYLTKTELRGAMDRLAKAVAEIDRALVGEQSDAAAVNATVLAQLREMREAAGTIDPGAARAVHPDIERNLEAFRRSLELAEGEARSSPPRYYLSGTIVGACTGCHSAERR